MDRPSVRKGIRDGALERDTYDRLTCTRCAVALQTENDPDELHTIRVCPDCNRRWKEMG